MPTPNEIDLNLDDIQVGTPTADGLPQQDMPSDTTPSTGDTHDQITVTDRNAPIVLLFGPPSSGKSMTLVRLSRYLHTQGFTVEPDRMFKNDQAYQHLCDQFLISLNTSRALPPTSLNDFLLVKVIKHGKTVCQIVEAPGEDFFDPREPNRINPTDFRPYLTQIINLLPNRKIWVFLTDAQWRDSTGRSLYVQRIKGCKRQLIASKDRVVLLYNKVDQRGEFFIDGKIIVKAAETAMCGEYPGLADTFANPNPITSLWRKYNYKFVPFCTGSYLTRPGEQVADYTESHPKYPEMLWMTLVNCFKG